MSFNQIEELNQKRFKKLKEVAFFLNNLNNVAIDRVFNFDIETIQLELRGLVEKLQRDTINISILSEVSSGKSTFLNALIFDEPVLESKIGETTAKIFNIKYDKNYSINGEQKETLSEIKEQIAIENAYNLQNLNKKRNITQLQSIITLPNENLKKGIELYDTPGFATLNEKSIMILLKETISKSDATILLLDISQGIKKSEHKFIKDMLPRVQTNKRFIVLNKYDSLIDSDNLILKSQEEIEDEIKTLIQNIESQLQEIQGETKKIETFHLSAKKALIAKMKNDSKKLEESRFKLFEDRFWSRVVEAKDEVFEDNVNAFNRLKKELNKNFEEEKKILLKNKMTLLIQLRDAIENRDKILSLELNLAKLKDLNAQSVNQKSKNRLIELENKLVENILNMLHLNLESELSSIPIKNLLLFWTLKGKYKESVLSVMENARSFIVKHIEFFIIEATKEERKKDAIISKINRDLNTLFSLEKYGQRVNLNMTINRVIERINNYIEWNIFSIVALLRYNISSKKERALEPSFIELKSEISTIKRDLNGIITNSKKELDEYIVSVTQKITKIKESLRNQESFELEIDKLSLFIKDIERFTT